MNIQMVNTYPNSAHPTKFHSLRSKHVQFSVTVSLMYWLLSAWRDGWVGWILHHVRYIQITCIF